MGTPVQSRLRLLVWRYTGIGNIRYCVLSSFRSDVDDVFTWITFNSGELEYDLEYMETPLRMRMNVVKCTNIVILT